MHCGVTCLPSRACKQHYVVDVITDAGSLLSSHRCCKTKFEFIVFVCILIKCGSSSCSVVNTVDNLGSMFVIVKTQVLVIDGFTLVESPIMCRLGMGC